jgi:hypothetical protein
MTAALVLVVSFAVTIFLSAFLLFAVQPMFTKMALPLLGGAPNVWNTAMVFFQAMLLAGYLYAHLLAKYLPVRMQLLVHLAVMAIGAAFLPIVLSGDLAPAVGAPAMWLIGLFAMTIGFPFFALSANAPLLQRWFSHTAHRSAHDPYFLYAASNLGSLLALVSYPLLVEPAMGLATQSGVWAWGFYLLIAAIALSGVAASLSARRVAAPAASQVGEDRSAEWKTRIEWAAIAFIPSALMLGVTSHLSANVASAPFIWVGPLALYLLTFIVAFSKTRAIRPEFIESIFPIVVLIGVFFIRQRIGSFSLAIAANLVIFFTIAQHCHNRLAALRPPPARLTEFYLAMSVGGVLGGAFTALIAPLIFNDVYEYAILMVASILVGLKALPGRADLRRIAALAVFGAAPLAAAAAIFDIFDASKIGVLTVDILALGVGYVLYRRRREIAAFAAGVGGLAVALAFAGGALSTEDNRTTLLQERDFFGVLKVVRTESSLGPYHVFIHGDTTHNAQLRADEFRREPLVYYSPKAPFGQAVDAMRRRKEGPLSVAVIGLGAGAMACYAKDGDNWAFYEINRSVVRMARDPALFTYLGDCLPEARIELGDARLKLKEARDKSFDLIIIDAFSSDSIPTHLVTREALALYQSKLADDGLVFFHTTNRIVDVTSVAASLAEGTGFSVRAIDYRRPEDDPLTGLRAPVRAVLVGRETVLESTLADYPGWKRFEPHPFVKAWTDDYSNVVGAIAANANGGGRHIDQ